MRIVGNCLIVFFAVSLFSCAKKKKLQVTEKVIEVVTLDSIPRKIDRKKLVILHSVVDEKLNDIQNFKSFNDSIVSMNKASFAALKSLNNSVIDQMDELPETLPENMNNKGVLSRFNEIKTYSKSLAEELKKRKIDTAEINVKTTKILTSYNHFIIQLNETAVELTEKFKKELEKSKPVTDSIQGVPLF